MARHGLGEPSRAFNFKLTNTQRAWIERYGREHGGMEVAQVIRFALEELARREDAVSVPKNFSETAV